MTNRQQGGSGTPETDQAKEAARKAAENRQQHQQDQGRGQQGGGEPDRNRASEAGRKAGQSEEKRSPSQDRDQQSEAGRKPGAR